MIEALSSTNTINQGAHLAKNTGKEYEQFVAGLQQALLNAEMFTNQNNITVEVDKIIVDNCGINRQFDIYWEYE